MSLRRLLAVAPLIALPFAPCRESSPSTTSETHFIKCDTDVDCAESGAGFTCVAGHCAPPAATCAAGESVACECNAADGGILLGQATCLAGGGVGACSCANGSTSCTPGEFITCFCPSNCFCGGTCLADGSGTTECQCFASGAPDANSGCTGPSCTGCASYFDFCVCITGDTSNCTNDCMLTLQGDPHCSACECEQCSPIDCLQDAGCQAINACMQQVGCNGSACYQPSTCQSVIDAYGGPTGTSAALATALISCALRAGCPCSG